MTTSAWVVRTMSAHLAIPSGTFVPDIQMFSCRMVTCATVVSSFRRWAYLTTQDMDTGLTPQEVAPRTPRRTSALAMR